MRILAIIVSTGILAAAAAADDSRPAATPAVQVYLPRVVQVEADALSLGLVGVVRSEDEALADKAAAVALGRAPQPREEIVIDRATILGRLASSGIPASQVRLTGADKVAISRNDKIIAAAELVKAAEALLAAARPSPQGTRWRLARGAQDLTVPAYDAIRLDAALAPHDVTSEAKVVVVAAAAAGRLASQTVLFKLCYTHREAVATADVSSGEVFTAKNVEVRTVESDSPEPADWTPPYGLLASQAVRAGAVVKPALARAVKAVPAVRRGESVVMRIRGSAFTLKAVGQALDDGRPNELVKVRNVDSGRIVVARVATDGAVEPVFEEAKQ
jgi:flagella basal body P-ring formation protein FlgA